MIYSIMPEDEIFKAKHAVRSECAQHGAFVQLEQRDKQQIISRVIATDPQIYLKPELQPGTLFKS